MSGKTPELAQPLLVTEAPTWSGLRRLALKN
jgi:hypothetical protein